MQLFSTLLLFIFLTLAPQPSFAQPQEIDGIIAVVDDDVVLASELAYRIQSIKTRFRETEAQLPPDSVLQTQVLDLLIMERLQLGAAQRVGIQIPDEQVNQTFAQLAGNNGLTPDQMLAQLVRDGQSVTGVFRDLRQELTLSLIHI